MRPTGWIDAAGRAAIEAAVAAAETRTRGEIVVALVGPCDEYGSAGWRCGALLAGLVLLAPGLFTRPLPLAGILLTQAAAVAAGHLLALWPPLRRLFVSQALMERAAERRAARAFAEHGLHRTRGATGILILVAPFEREVVVLADEGVTSRLDAGETWEEVVTLILDGIRRGSAAEGIVAGVERCADVLAQPLPPQGEPEDEIRRALVIED